MPELEETNPRIERANQLRSDRNKKDSGTFC